MIPSGHPPLHVLLCRERRSQQQQQQQLKDQQQLQRIIELRLRHLQLLCRPCLQGGGVATDDKKCF